LKTKPRVPGRLPAAVARRRGPRTKSRIAGLFLAAVARRRGPRTKLRTVALLLVALAVLLLLAGCFFFRRSRSTAEGGGGHGRTRVRRVTLGQVVTAAADRHRVPRAILWGLVEQESSWNPAAQSPTGARGLLQFVKVTAREFGLRVDSRVDERLDPVRAADAGARYLRRIYDGLSQVRNETERWRLALAGYNRGPTRLRKTIRAARAARRWDGTWASLLERRLWRTSDAGYREVRLHVARILGERGKAGGLAAKYGYGR